MNDQKINLITKQTLLALIAQYLPNDPQIVEAGAFNGRDTQKLSAQWPQGIIHAFEPVPEIFALLEQNTAHLSHVRRYQLALGETTGSSTFFVSENPAKPGQPFQAGSLLKPKERLEWSDAQYKKTITVPTITLDDWAAQNNIDHIDFLWLDMQGFELNVIKASPQILSTVKVIYTEVEFVEAYEGQYQYEDVKNWLEMNEFTLIAKDFADQTSWFYGNALFVRSPR